MRDSTRSVLKWGAAAADAVRDRTGLVLLLYHRVGARTAVSVDLPRSLFSRQLEELTERYAPVTLDEVAHLVAAPGPPAGRPPVCITFDDGTADFVDEALPELVRHTVPVALYLATNYVESQTPFPDGSRPVSWAGLRDAVATGLVTVGSHTHTHLLLDRVDGRAAADEIERSVGLVQERLGLACAHFAYPKALLGSPEAEAAVRQRFLTAAVAGTRPNPYGHTDLHRLHRSPVQRNDGMRWFRHKVAGGMSLENDLRDLLNRRRYAGASR